MVNTKIQLFYKRETPNKVVFDEDVNPKEKKLGSLYIRKKYYVELGEPTEIEVEIEPIKK